MKQTRMDRCQVPAEQILGLVEELLNFPFPQICRHSVCGSLLDLLERNGFPIDNELCEAVVRANDEEALERLETAKGLS